MIVQNCSVLMEILSKIESMIIDQKTQHPYLSDEDIINQIKLKLHSENKI